MISVRGHSAVFDRLKNELPDYMELLNQEDNQVAIDQIRNMGLVVEINGVVWEGDTGPYMELPEVLDEEYEDE